MANADLIVNNVREIKNGTKINDDVNEKGHWNNVYIKKIVNEILLHVAVTVIKYMKLIISTIVQRIL